MNFAVVIVFIIILYQYRYGLQMLLPTKDGWLMTHDWATHYLGWFFFRNEPWTFPLGDISRYFHPVGTNIAFTDSIPLVAIPLKVFSPLLPETFQYIGLWLFSCHILLGFFLIKLFSRFSIYGIPQLFATMIIVVNPVLLHRSIHPALCTHWLIVACLWIYYLDLNKTGVNKVLLFQAIVLFVSGMINPYMCAMVAMFSIVLPLRISIVEKRISLRHLLLYWLSTFSVLLFLFYLIGFLSFQQQTDLGVSGAYGLYSMNLNSLYNSSGFSRFLPALNTVSWHQYESFLYLGLGVILLIGLTLTLSVIPGESRLRNDQNVGIKFSLPLLIGVLLVSAFAITNTVTLNDKVLFKLSIPMELERLGEIFRASARFFWVTYYLILIAILAYFISKVSTIASSASLIFVFVVQLYDYRSLVGNHHLNFVTYKPPISESWYELIKRSDQVIFYPPLGTTYLTDQDYRYFCYIAAKYKKPINIGYVARQDNNASVAYSKQLSEQLDNEQIQPKALYISTISGSNSLVLPFQSGLLNCLNIDNYLAFYPKDLVSPSEENQLKSLSQDIPSGLKNRVSFKSFDLGPRDQEGDLFTGIDAQKSFEKRLMISGWAFIAGKTKAESDSIGLLLKNMDGKLYKAKASLDLRKDVSSYFKNPMLDSTGFYGQFFTDSLAKGSYELGIYVKQKGRQELIYKFTNRINVGYPMQFKVSSLADSVRYADFHCNIDQLEEFEKSIKIGGWAALPERNSTGCQISILFKSNNGKIFISPTNNTLRPDVTEYFNNKFKLDDSGFDASISKDGMPVGIYQIGILIDEVKSKNKFAYFTNKQIEIKPTN